VCYFSSSPFPTAENSVNCPVSTVQGSRRVDRHALEAPQGPVTTLHQSKLAAMMARTHSRTRSQSHPHFLASSYVCLVLAFSFYIHFLVGTRFLFYSLPWRRSDACLDLHLQPGPGFISMSELPCCKLCWKSKKRGKVKRRWQGKEYRPRKLFSARCVRTHQGKFPLKAAAFREMLYGFPTSTYHFPLPTCQNSSSESSSSAFVTPLQKEKHGSPGKWIFMD